jgi:dolichol-phosphate mannosyltransferase
MRKFGKFVITSVLISLLNLVLLYLLTDVIGLWYMASAIILTVALVVVSFTINYIWTWRSQYTKLKAKMIAPRFIKYSIVGGGTTILVLGLFYVLTEFVHIWYLISSLITWFVAITVAFLANNFWTYGKQDESSVS